MKALYGHTDQATAYVVDDYPYGRTLRCRIRYWIESHPARGFRWVSQTTNPKKSFEVWNKPHPGTYSLLAACMYLDERSHVQARALSEYSKAEEVRDFIVNFPHADLSRLHEWVAKKILYTEGRLSGALKWTIGGKVQEDSDHERDEMRKELSVWKEAQAGLAGIEVLRK